MPEVVWTRRARRNLDDIGSYIASDDPTAAARVVERVASSVDRLAEYPMLGRSGAVEETRELVVAGTPYIVIYRLTHRVEILRIRHGTQRWP
jgi:addiction module RelE/StbE family toxin